jgi:hypothetical protein
MGLKHLTASVAISICLSGVATADHWLQTADPAVVQALNEMVQVYGGVCQQGNPQGCQAMQYVQQLGGQMLNAGYECQTAGNQQACQFYQQAYNQLEQDYYATQQAVNQGQFAAQQPGYDGSTHAERMQEIHNWGQQRLDWGRQQGAINDQNHQKFLEYLRQ